MNLQQASRCLFARSERNLRYGLILSGLLLVLTIVTLTQHGPITDTALVLTIAITQLGQMWMKYRALYWFALADEPRRMAQFEYGLGHPPSALRCAAIEREAGLCDTPTDPAYWLSQKPVGPVRMVEMVLESSFYTNYLASKCQGIFRWIGITGTLVSTIVLVGAYELRDAKHTSDLVSHIIVLIFVFFLTGDFWSFYLQYRDLADASQRSHEQAFELLRRGVIGENDALELAMTYNTAVAQSPPVFTFLHKRYKDQIEVLFKRSFGSLIGL
jgi:hypothetical protein